MANASSVAFKGSADLNLWFKVRDGDVLKLSDIPDIIPLRWSYFRDNWEFIKPRIIKAATSYSNPDFLYSQIILFSDFIDKQRNSAININPFADINIYYRFYAIFDNVAIQDINLTNE